MRNNWTVWGVILLGVLLLLGLIGGVQLNNSIAAVDQRSKALEARVDDAGSEDALAALTARQDALEAKLAAIVPADLTPLEGALDELRSGLAALEDRVDSSTTAAGVEALAARLDTLEATVTALPAPADLAPVTASLEQLRGNVVGLAAQIGDLTPAALAELAGRVTATESAVAAITPTDLAPLTSDVAGLSTEVSGLGTRVGAVETNLAAISFPSLQPLEDKLADLDDRVGAIQPVDLGPLETEVASIQSAIGSVTDELADAQTGITQLRTAVIAKASPADVAKVAAQVTALGARIDALPEAVDVEPLRSQIAALETSFGSLQNAVTQLQNAPAPIAPVVPSLAALESIYFGPASTSVSDEEMAKVTALAARLGATPGELSIVGFSDSSGPAELNRALSLRRAAAVRLALIEAGVSPAALTSVTGLGEDAPPVSTGDDTDEAGNRVVVVYGRQ